MSENTKDTSPRPVLIATVGTGRVRSDIAEAIILSLTQQKAEYAVFLCSKKTDKETLPVLLKQLDWPEDRYRVHVSDDENNVESLFITWNRCWDEWLSDWSPTTAIVDFTSGTKPMSAAAVLLAISRGAAGLSYVTGKRDETGRVIRSTSVARIAPDLVTAHRQLRMAVEHFHVGNYAAARDIAAAYRKINDLKDDHLRNIALSIHYLAAACEAWDRFDYKTAYAAMHDCRKYWKNWLWVESPDRLAANTEIILKAREACSKQAFSPPLAADLIGNARRCMAREAWDDAVVRLYRGCELLAQMVLLWKFKLKTGNIDTTKLPQELRETYEQRRGHDGRVKLALYDSYHLLKQLDNPLGKEFISRYGMNPEWGDLHNRLEKRNQSLLGHGATPIAKDDAKALFEHVEALAKIADPSILDEWLPKTVPVRFMAF